MKFNKVKTGFSIQSENFRHSITCKKFPLWLYRNEWEFSLPVKYINAIACIQYYLSARMYGQMWLSGSKLANF